MNKNTMKNIKRYNAYLYLKSDREDWGMEEGLDGHYVLYSDYCLLLDKIKELTKENNDLKDHCFLTGGYN